MEIVLTNENTKHKLTKLQDSYNSPKHFAQSEVLTSLHVVHVIVVGIKNYILE